MCMCVVRQSLQGVWIKGLTDAVCTAVNVKYRLLAFGREKYVLSNRSLATSTCNSNSCHMSFEPYMYILNNHTCSCM